MIHFSGPQEADRDPVSLCSHVTRRNSNSVFLEAEALSDVIKTRQVFKLAQPHKIRRDILTVRRCMSDTWIVQLKRKTLQWC